MTQQVRKEERFDLRATPQQSTLIRRAAEARGQSYTAFIMESATDRAAEILMDQTRFVLDASTWKRFKAKLDAPAEPVEALVELFRSDL
jgi:uncharacterized protein (DUF1778 family)